MEIFASSEFWYFLLRWFHFLAGVMWIGILWYFNFVQTPFFATELGGQARGAVVRGLVPTALWYFRWGAMFTFLTGWTILISKIVGGVPHTSPYVTLILTGGLLGTLMWANVWFVIWPNQRTVIANAEAVAAGQPANPAAAAAGARAGLASRTNTLFSIPMLFFMGSASHFPSLASKLAIGQGHAGVYWLVFLVLAGAAEYNALAGKADQKLAKPPVGPVVHAGLGLTVLLFVSALILL
ncbi:MAG TPA: urate hydroxylase PuuD [Myxococcota bacterium]|jgi:uncharacterized membrane protein|nr:urate hydroxylase PuuD [Myxococcota bacterium]